MGAYQLKPDDTELAALLTRAAAGEEISVERDGAVIAKIIPFRQPEPPKAKSFRPYGLNIMGLNGDTSWLDEPLDEETQRAFGMID